MALSKAGVLRNFTAADFEALFGKGSSDPGDTFAADAAITASDSTNAAKLAGLGYVADPQTPWTTGMKLTVGTFDFHWTGTAWAAGAAT
jgi:hypothetical protein